MASKKTVASKTVVPDGGDQVTVGGGETEHGDQDTCSICLEVLPVFGHEFIRLTCCGNALHFECGSRLGKEKCGLACPMCRAPTDVADETRHAQALRWADQGKAWAIFVVGTSYMSGLGVLQSDETARLWLQRAAELGHPGAQFNLGRMHFKGEGGSVSMEHFFFWMTRADEQGYEQAAAVLEALKSMCFSCGKTGNMKCCARCKCAYYCSRECQAAAWNGGHKAACKQIRRKQQRAK